MTLAINIKAEVGTIDAKSFTKTMDRELEKLFAECARAFLLAAVRRIPVRTGFLRGAFSRLEDVIGAVEFSAAKSSVGAVRKRRETTRPGRDSRSVALKLVKARTRQQTLLRKISQLRKREERRFADELQKKQLKGDAGTKQEKAKESISENQQRATARGQAIRDRRLRQKLIKLALTNSQTIEKLSNDLKTRYNIKLSKRLGDYERNQQLTLEALKERREQRFFKVLKNLRRLHFGYITTRIRPPRKLASGILKGGKERVRVKGVMGAEEYQRRLKRLQERLGLPNRSMKRIEERLAKVQQRYIQITQKGLQKTRLKLIKRVTDSYRERIKNAKSSHEEDELIREQTKEITRRLTRIAKSRIRRAGAGHPLLDLASHTRHLENMRNLTLRQQAANEDYLNTVARVSGRGKVRIVGQTQAGKFDLREGERVLKTFKLVEFYYPSAGSKAGRIQKTPRSGRIFATVPSKIIVKNQGKQNPNAAVFQQLASSLKASGKAVPANVANAAKEFQDAIAGYTFNFGINIRYLPINEVKQAWFAWQAGIRAFQNHLNSNALKRIPKLQDFILTETHELTGEKRSIRVGRK